jgi:ankyrin repeat protein
VVALLTCLLTCLTTACTPDGAGGRAEPARSPGPQATSQDFPSPRKLQRPTREPLTPAEQDELDRRLIAAAWANDLPRARRLVARGADVNTEDETQQSAFLIATSEGYYRLLELTLRQGADVDAKDSYNGTGLIRAAERGHADVVRRLIRAGIELDHVNNLGWTALLEAVILGDGSARYQETVRVLLGAGADAGIADDDGVTALQHAEASGQTAVARILRRG